MSNAPAFTRAKNHSNVAQPVSVVPCFLYTVLSELYNEMAKNKRNTHPLCFFFPPNWQSSREKIKQKTSTLACTSGAQKYPLYISLSPLAIVRNTTAPWSYPRRPTQKPRSLPLHHNRTVNTLLSQFRALKQPWCVQTQGLFCSSSWMSIVLDPFSVTISIYVKLFLCMYAWVRSKAAGRSEGMNGNARWLAF